MPIKGLSEDIRMPRLGKIHLGIRDPAKGFPVKTDYFVLPKDHSDYSKLVKAYGEKPKELRILIPVEDAEEWATQYYKAYDMTRGLICKGDGEVATRMVDIKTGSLPTKETGTVDMRETVCPGRDCPDYQAKKCGEVMNLKFLLPEVPGLGVWQIDTGSINSILNINSCAKIIKKAFGRITLIPLKLTLESIQVNNPDTKKKQTAYVLNLRADVTLAQLADAAREQSKMFQIEPPDLEAAYDREIAETTAALYPEVDRQESEPEEKPQPPPAASPAQTEAFDSAQAKAPKEQSSTGVPLATKEQIEKLKTTDKRKLAAMLNKNGWPGVPEKWTQPQAEKLISDLGL